MHLPGSCGLNRTILRPAAGSRFGIQPREKGLSGRAMVERRAGGGCWVLVAIGSVGAEEWEEGEGGWNCHQLTGQVTKDDSCQISHIVHTPCRRTPFGPPAMTTRQDSQVRA